MARKPKKHTIRICQTRDLDSWWWRVVTPEGQGYQSSGRRMTEAEARASAEDFIDKGCPYDKPDPISYTYER